MKDKLKILSNELDILQNEVQVKDKLLTQVGIGGGVGGRQASKRAGMRIKQSRASGLHKVHKT